MVRRCSDRLAKLLMVVFNCVFLVCGIAIVAVGFTDIGPIHKVQDLVDGLSKVNVFFVVLGAIVMFISFLGCCGAWRENNCMVTTFMLILTVVLVAEIAVGVLAFKNRNSIESSLKTELKNSLENYKKNESVAVNAWNDLQHTLHCCGANSYKNYEELGMKLPASCCNDDKAGPTCPKDDSQVWPTPCSQKIEELIKGQSLSIGVTAIVIGFIEVVGIIFACCLRSAISEKYETV